jgi:hypothetical protein
MFLKIRRSAMGSRLIHRVVVPICSLILIVSFCSDRQFAQEAARGCEALVKGKAHIYISIDQSWRDVNTAKLILHNNSNCAIKLITTGRQTLVTPGSPIIITLADEIIDGATVVLRYKVNTDASPGVFVGSWAYGDSVISSRLEGGKTVKFAVPVKSILNKRQIAVPFKYAWEISTDAPVEHLVYSPTIAR